VIRTAAVDGGRFDALARHARWIAVIGDWAYRLALVVKFRLRDPFAWRRGVMGRKE